MKPPEDRLALGSAALLSVARAVELMPVRDADARKLIEDAGIVRRLAGRRVVRWGDCEALARLEKEPTADKARPVRGLRRGQL